MPVADALVLALAGEALLLAGGYLGGALVYVHGHRVLSQPQAPVGEALRPRRLSSRTTGLPAATPAGPPRGPDPVTDKRAQRAALKEM